MNPDYRRNACCVGFFLAIFFVTFSRFTWPQVALSDSLSPQEVLIFAPHSSEPIRLNYKQLEKDVSRRFVHPDPAIDPKRLEQVFSGVSLSSLLKSAKADVSGNPLVTIAASKYLVEDHLENLLKSGSFIATSVNDREMALKDGLPGLAFTDRSGLYGKPELWVWWVNAMFIGKHRPKLLLDGKNVDFASCSAVRQHVLPYPRGYRAGNSAQKDKPVLNQFCSISDLQKVKQNSICEMSVSSYTEGSKNLKGACESFKIYFSSSGQPIVPSLGGPVILCSGEQVSECVFHTFSINHLRTTR